MANVSQIEINGATYDLVAATARNQYNNFTDYYLYGDDMPLDTTNYSPDHARFLLKKSLGMVTGGNTTASPTPPIYGLFMWQDTGNIRSDKYDIDTDTVTTRGYVPLSMTTGTKNCVATAGGTSLITAASGWTITNCSITRWGQMIDFYMAAKRNAAFSVNAIGGTSNTTVGTLANSNYWPAIEMGLRSNANSDVTGVWGYINTSGSIIVSAFEGTGSSRSIAANSVIHLGGSWIARMDNNF